jgi:hypothetical protein
MKLHTLLGKTQGKEKLWLPQSTLKMPAWLEKGPWEEMQVDNTQLLENPWDPHRGDLALYDQHSVQNRVIQNVDPWALPYDCWLSKRQLGICILSGYPDISWTHWSLRITADISINLFFFFLVVLGLELRISHLLGRWSTTWATLPALFLCFFFFF